MTLSIVVPCFNEEDGIFKLRDELMPVAHALAQSQPVEVIFVDDGSKDQTWAALNATFGVSAETTNLSVRLLCHPTNLGLGAAVRTGLAAAKGDVIVTTDSDGTYEFASIPGLLDRLQPGVDIVTASPYHPEGGVEGVPGYRLALSQGASLIYRGLLAGRGVYCYTALYRAYRRPVIEAVSFDANDFLGGTELMVKAMLKGFRVAEFPAVLHARTHGVSKARLARTVRSHLRFQRRVLLHQLRVRPLVKGGAGRPLTSARGA